jgi:hypothetical protein
MKSDIRQTDRILAFARYVSWADLLKSLFQSEMANEASMTEPVEMRKHKWRRFGLMCYWYASLYAVIEAWDELQFSDPTIDRLLAHPKDFRALLRRYRNGVSHFQSSLLDPRIIDFLRYGAAHVCWVHALHDEVVRFFAEHLASRFARDGQRPELREAIEGVVNWYPCREAPAIESLERTLSDTRDMLAAHPDDRSQEREELERSLASAEAILHEGRGNWAALRTAILREAGVEQSRGLTETGPDGASENTCRA